MPHDSKGEKLNRGDVVFLMAKVEEVFQSEDACNVNLKILGHEEYLPCITCNSRLTTRQGFILNESSEKCNPTFGN